MRKNLLFGAVLSCSMLGAGEWFVSPAGNDKNPGTAKKPWATIAFAASKAQPGDTVKIGPGVYREQIVFTRSGKKEAPISFVGTRDKKGNFLTIVEGVGTTLSNWKRAPEIAPDVWKTDLERRPDLMMMDGKMIGYINKYTMALPRMKQLPEELDEILLWHKFGPGCKRCPGLDLLALKKDILIRHRYFGKRKELFWPAIGNVLTGWSNGKLYIRFADGSTPDKHKITASYGKGFTLKKASWLRFSDLHMRGSRYQIHMIWRSSNNVVENCLLMHGGARVRMERGTVNNVVRNSILTAGFIRGDLFQLRSRNDMRGGVLYEFFKYIIGASLSDDMGIQNYGTGTIVHDNVILQGLIGIDANAQECEFFNNVVMQMSSVGIYTGARTIGKFHHNLLINNAIPIRIHDLRGARAKRVEHHYKNVVIQAPNDGSQIFVHCSSHVSGPDTVNFEPPRPEHKYPVYKKDPPAPVDPGRFYIYHNTFWGGGDVEPGFYVGYYYNRFRKSVMPFVFVNNVVKGCHRWEEHSQEMLAGNLLYNYPSAANQHPLRYPEVKKHNVLIPEKSLHTLWNNKNIPGLYDLTLAKNSPAIGIGIDISKPFTFKGKEYAPFPGFKPGYFKGKAPAAGAFQEGESQQFFIDLYRKAQKAAEIIKNAK